MSSSEYLTRLLAAFGQAFRPLTEALVSRESFSAFLAEFGWKLDEDAEIASVQATFTAVSAAVATVDHDAASRNPVLLGADIAKLTRALFDLDSTSGSALPPPLDTRAFWDTFPDELGQYLTYRYLRDHVALLFGILRFVGVLGEKAEPADPATGRMAFTRRTVDWSRLPQVVTRADQLFADVYGWGSTFDHRLFIDNLAALLTGFQVPAFPQRPPRFLLDAYYAPANAERSRVMWVSASPLLISTSERPEAALVKISVGALPVPPANSPTAAPVGIALAPVVTGEASAAIALSENVSAVVSGGFASAFVRLEIRPSATKVAVEPIAAEVHGGLQILAERTPGWVPIGDPESTRFEFDKAHVGLSAEGEVENLEKIDCRIELAIDSGRLVLDLGEGDGFLHEIFGTGTREVAFAPKASWSNRTGFRLEGQGLLEASLPVHLDLAGVLRVNTLYIALGATPDGADASLVLALSGDLALGPLVASVDRIGLRMVASPRDKASPGNLGLLDVRFAFKPPDGAGLAVDAGPVAGGGYLFFDTEKEEYAGILQLEFEEKFSLTAVGLITTRMPDGGRGFSLVIIVSAQGFTPIQLGYGFTLNGVGGLLGLNRTVAVEVLRAGIKTGALDAVLFPEDPLRNAPTIISTLRTAFPPAPNRFLIGPMAIIGWGTPTLVTLELGILVELPAPVRLVVLGQLRAILPSEEAGLVVLKMDILGIVDFARREISVDATLYDSTLAEYTLTGDMALRARWGANPTLVLAVGGLHPRFQPPPGFPTLDRIAVALATGDNPRIRLEGYLALTANTAQVGARLEIWAREGGVSLEGTVGFDALFHFDPFEFVADVGGRVALRKGGNTLAAVGLDMTLTGPRPWHAWGKAKVEILFVKYAVHFDARFGRDTPPPMPAPVDVAALLVAAAGDARNWSGELPRGERPLVSLRPAASEAVLVHPLAELTLRQRVVPLDVTITHFGGTRVAGERRFTITGVSLRGEDVEPTAVTEPFAPAQFFDLSDDEALSRPSFEALRAGARLPAPPPRLGKPIATPIAYETLVLDPLYVAPPQGEGTYSPPAESVPAAARVGAAGRAALRRTGRSRYRTAGTPVSVSDDIYAVVSTEDLQPEEGMAAGAGGVGSSYTSALDALRDHLAGHPDRRGTVQVASAGG